MRSLQPSLTPIPNATAFGPAGSVIAQLFYDGVEQFYCQADTCMQSLGASDPGAADWECQNLRCTCRKGTTFCGAVPSSNLTATVDTLGGTLGIKCEAVDPTSNIATCNFVQTVLQSLFGASGLTLNGCSFGECVAQSVIDSGGNLTHASSSSQGGKSLSGGVIAGLAVVGGLVFAALLLLALGFRTQRAARRNGLGDVRGARVSVYWSNLSYIIPGAGRQSGWIGKARNLRDGSTAVNDDKVILDSVTGRVQPGQMMAILGPSGKCTKTAWSLQYSLILGAGKTTLVEILAGKNKSGIVTGIVDFPFETAENRTSPRIGFVPQQDILPATLTVSEALLFAARLRLPESVPDVEKQRRVDELLEKLGIESIKHTRIGDVTGGKARGISGGEMRRVSIGLELIASPDVLLLDEPTSGLYYSFCRVLI